MEPTEPPKRPAETTEDSSEPPAKRQKPSTAPLHGALRRTFLRKHASLLSHLDPAKGLLVTVSTRQEARGLGQFRSFLDKMVEMLLPDAVLEPKVSVRGIDGRDDAPESDEESGIEVGNEDAKEGGAEEHDYTEKSKEKGGITYQGSMIEAVDTGCQGLLFFRLRVKEVDVVGFVGRVFEYLRNLPEKEKRKWVSKLSFCHRILPIQFTTEASKPSIIAALTPLLPQLDPSQSYAIDFSARNNAPLSSAKMEIINAVAALIPNKVNLKEPEQKVEIHIVKSVAMVCVVKEFGRMGRWNLQRALGAVE